MKELLEGKDLFTLQLMIEMLFFSRPKNIQRIHCGLAKRFGKLSLFFWTISILDFALSYTKEIVGISIDNYLCFPCSRFILFFWERSVLFAFRCADFLPAVLTVCIPFPFGVGGGCAIRLYRFLIIAFSSTFILLQNTDLSPKRSAPLAYKHRRVTMATNGNVIRCNFQTLGRSYIVFIFIDALIIEMHFDWLSFKLPAQKMYVYGKMKISWLYHGWQGYVYRLLHQYTVPPTPPGLHPWWVLHGQMAKNDENYFLNLCLQFNRDTIFCE